MLGKVLKKETCAECRFCCSFRRCSLWETPLFPMETVEKIENKKFVRRTVGGADCGQMDLNYKYKTDDPQEEAACEFLDPQKGCTLSADDKPFDCKIWPLRIMRKDGRLVIALTPTCPAINEVGEQRMRELVHDGLGTTIRDYAAAHPFIIKDYKDGFLVLMEVEASFCNAENQAYIMKSVNELRAGKGTVHELIETQERNNE
jgi:Fe-S-cluster containining protein